MIEKGLWTANFLLALANLLMGIAWISFAGYLAGIVCTIVCIITYKDTWR